MKNFAALITALDQTTKTNTKLRALVEYFNNTVDEDKLWAVALFSHKRPKRQVNTTYLREWAAELANVPLWLFEDSYHIVGDLAETISLILPKPKTSTNQSLSNWINYLIQLKNLEETEKKERVIEAWQSLNQTERFVFNKLITGGWRIGVSKNLMIQALAKHTSKEAAEIAHRIMGNWSAESHNFNSIFYEENIQLQLSKPYPFYLAYALEVEPEKLGKITEWQAEWKWDGIRSQLIKRGDELFLWSRGEELITNKFPEFKLLQSQLPNGIAIDGELMPFKDDKALNFQLLQTRIGRKNVTKSTIAKCPVIIMAYDLLEFKGKDVRHLPLTERRKHLTKIINDLDKLDFIRLSNLVVANNWRELLQQQKTARNIGSEGLMLKKKAAVYKVGRKRGDWWKWKVDPFSIDGVLIYAMRGHGRRANLYTDYTFGVWDGDRLVSFTKAYSGLTDEEFKAVDRFVKQNTIERFGPVRTVTPQLVFELHFEGIAASKRHKSGVALRFPRMHCWRKDKPAKEANTLNDLQLLLDKYG